MKSKLRCSRGITPDCRVEYTVTKDGGELSIIAAMGIWQCIIRGKEANDLHEALHEAAIAGVALDTVGTESLQWPVAENGPQDIPKRTPM